MSSMTNCVELKVLSIVYGLIKDCVVWQIFKIYTFKLEVLQMLHLVHVRRTV